MLPWEAWLSLAVAGTLLVSLALRLAATDLLALSCLGILVVAQNLTGSNLLPTPEQAVAGFGNSGLITIGLFVIVGAFLPQDYSVSRSIVIDAQPSAIHGYVGDLKRWPKWGPW